MARDRLADRKQADLYCHILWEAITGPFARQIRQEHGPGLISVCEAALQRASKRLPREPADLALDEIEWALVKLLAPTMLREYDDSTFHSTTGHGIDELTELQRVALASDQPLDGRA